MTVHRFRADQACASEEATSLQVQREREREREQEVAGAATDIDHREHPPCAPPHLVRDPDWTMHTVLDHLATRLTGEQCALLGALVAATSAGDVGPLESLQVWRELAPVPLRA